MLDVVWLIPALPAGRVRADPAVRPPPRRPEGRLPRHADGRRRRSSSPSACSSTCCRKSGRGARARRRRCSRGCRSASLQVDMAFLADPLSITMCLFVTGIGTLIHLYADRLHARRPEVLQVLPLPQPVRVLDADARARREPARHVPRLGGRRHLLVLPDLVLARRGSRRRPPARRRSSPTASATGASCWRCSSPSRRVGSLSYVGAQRRRRGRRARPVDGDGDRRCCCSSGPSARAPSCRCTSGCPTRWRARRRCRR